MRSLSRRALLSAALASVALADPPQPVLDLLRSAAEALADQDPMAFLNLFDRAMPGYDRLRDEILALLAAQDISSTIEIVNDQGSDTARDLDLDWVLRIGSSEPRRALLKCRVERRGRSWKFTQFSPVEFFAWKPAA
jgi:hypothetical protein